MIDRSWTGLQQFAARIRVGHVINVLLSVFYLSIVSTSRVLFHSADIIRETISMGMKGAGSYGVGEKYT
jgi:hypothetical protein